MQPLVTLHNRATFQKQDQDGKCEKGCFACSFCFYFTFSVSCARADREATGVGAFDVAQHAQEAGVLPAGSAGHGHREETCKKGTVS